MYILFSLFYRSLMLLQKKVACSLLAHKGIPPKMFYIYHLALVKSRRNLCTACTQKKNVNFIKINIQNYKVHNGPTTYSQFYASRKYDLPKNFLHGQRQGLNQIHHYHSAVSSRNLKHGGSRNQLLTAPRHQYLLVTPQRHMSLAWLDSLAVTQAGWFKALAQSRLVENLMEGLQAIHDYSHLPWWSTIILSTILMRSALTFPLAVYQVRVSVLFHEQKV